VSAARRIAVIGTGSLARSVCFSLASLLDQPTEVSVIGRSVAALAELSYVASTRASLAGRQITFRPCADPLTGEDELVSTLTSAGASLVVCCASRQSPWEAASAPSAWTALTAKAGIALTLPLNADLALLAARAAQRTPGRPQLINACYPDAVNPLLAAVEVPVLTGVGNVALLDSSIRRTFTQDALAPGATAPLRVIGHHLHLHSPAPGVAEARAWLGARELADVGARLAEQRATSRRELNAVTGFHAALVIRALLSGALLHTSLPGPAGLPGGYPVLLRDGSVETDLPAGVTLAQAVAWNQRWAAHEGVIVDPAAGTVEFTGPAAETLAAHLPGQPARFRAADGLGELTRRLLRLRETLRARPPGHPLPADTPGIGREDHDA
jgi:hypothetical protein